MRKRASSLPRLPQDARAKGLAHAEAAISANGLTHLVIGVYVLISAAVWWFGAYKEFHFGHGPNGEDVWQRWPIAYVFLCLAFFFFFGALLGHARLVNALRDDLPTVGVWEWTDERGCGGQGALRLRLGWQLRWQLQADTPVMARCVCAILYGWPA